MQKRPAGTIVAAALLLLAGCHRYVPVDPASVPAGGDVQVHLTRAGVDSLREVSPELRESAVQGTLARTDDDALLLRVPVGTRRDGLHRSTIDQQVRVPRNHVVQVERRELDRTKTGLVVTGGATVLGAVLFLVLDGSELYSDDPVPEAPETRIPFLSSLLARLSVP